VVSSQFISFEVVFKVSRDEAMPIDQYLLTSFSLERVSRRAAQRLALPALGRGRRSRPTRKRLRRRKLLENGAESPASGARFVGQLNG